MKKYSWVFEFERLLGESINQLPNNFIIALSGGVDSSMLLFSMLERKKIPEGGVTFRLGEKDNIDLQYAKKIVELYNLPLYIAEIPFLNKQELIDELKEMLSITKMPRSIDTQACYGFFYMIKELLRRDISCRNIVTGMYENSHYYAPTRDVSFKYRDLKRGKISRKEFDYWYNNIRACINNKKTLSGTKHNYEVIREFLAYFGFTLYTPLHYQPLFELTQTLTYEDLFFYKGKFKPKFWITRIMFKDYFNRVGNATNINNMQDVCLKDYHRKILLPGTKYKNTNGVYNSILKSVRMSKGFLCG